MMAVEQEAKYIVLQVLNMFIPWNVLWNGKSLTHCHVDPGGSGPVVRLESHSNCLSSRVFTWLGTSVVELSFWGSAGRESNQWNGKGVNKFPYLNSNKHVIPKHRNEAKSHLQCRCHLFSFMLLQYEMLSGSVMLFHSC